MFAMMVVAALTADPAPPRVQALTIGASWCAPCKFQRKDCDKLKPNVTVGELETDQIRFVDGDKKPEFVDTFNVEAFPTTILLLDGREVQRWKGQTTALAIAGAMLREQEKLLKGAK